MKNDKHQPSLQPTPTDIVVPSGPSATVVVADGSHVPRYGAIPYGGFSAPEEAKQVEKEQR